MNSQEFHIPYSDDMHNLTADLWEGSLLYEEQAIDMFKAGGFF
jgi:hypothetical protein